LHNHYPDRVYKTGDRGRWLHLEEIEFLGRNDNQLKIRGSRVELGEVEAVLSKHPSIEECVIITKDHSDGSPYLVAFIASSEKMETHVIREFLANYLPIYMIPDYFVWLPSLPHTISGKVDRKLLGTYSNIEQELSNNNTPPTTQLEQQIADIWKECLNVSSISLQSNFFDVGGHSLLMVQVQMKLNATLGKDIPLIDMFKFPTIKALAQHLSTDVAQIDFLQQGKQRSLLRQRLMKRK
jgi:acyl carrier protein